MSTQLTPPQAPVRNVELQTRVRGPRPPFIIRALVAALAFLFALPVICLLTEGVFALCHIGEEEFLIFDPQIGFWHPKNKLITFRSEGFSQDRTTSDGRRDLECALAKPVNEFRIAILGDSKAEALQVPIEQSAGKQLERMLSKQRQDGRQVRVLNFGMSAFSTGQEYLTYINRVRAYKPDMVILFYHMQDAEENCFAPLERNPTPRPYFSIDNAGRLQIDWHVMRDWSQSDRAKLYRTFDSVRTSNRLWGVFSKLEPILTGNKTFQKLDEAVISKVGAFAHPLVSNKLSGYEMSEPQLQEIDPGTATPLPPHVVNSGKANSQPVAPSPEAAIYQIMLRGAEARWPVTAALLYRLNELCKADNCKLVVAALPAPNNAIFFIRELPRIQRQAKADGFLFVNVHEQFPQLGPMQKSELYYHKAHFTPLGHNKLARALFKAIVQWQTAPVATR